MVLLEVLLALAGAVVCVTVGMLVWATWFKTPPPQPQAPPDPVAQAVQQAEDQLWLDHLDDDPAEEEPAPAPPPLPDALQHRDHPTMFFRASDGQWYSSDPEAASMQDAQMRELMNQGTLLEVSRADLEAVFREVNATLQALTRDMVQNFQVNFGGNGGAGGTALSNFSGDPSMRFSTLIHQATLNIRARRTQEAPATPAAAAAPPPPAAPKTPNDPSKFDRLLSDDDLV